MISSDSFYVDKFYSVLCSSTQNSLFTCVFQVAYNRFQRFGYQLYIIMDKTVEVETVMKGSRGIVIKLIRTCF